MSERLEQRAFQPALWQSLPGMVLVLSRQGEALHISRDFRKFAGLDDRDAQSSDWTAALKPEAKAALQVCLAAGQDFTLQLEFDIGGARPGWVELAAHMLGGLGYFVCLLHDVSAAQYADLAAHVSAERLRLLADNMPALIAYYSGATFRCEFANRHYARAFGLDEQSIIGRSAAEIIGESAAEEIAPHVKRMLTERRAVVYERLAPSDGSARWLSVHLVPQLNAAAEIVGAFVMVTDVTQSRQAELAMRESEERLAKFLQASAEGIVFHRDGIITDANPALLALLGYSLEEVLGRPTLEFVAPDHVDQVTAVMRSGAETSYESVVLDRNGGRIPVEFIVRSMAYGGEQLRMAIVRDIRDRRAAQERINFLAHNDALTGLPNRTTFVEQVERQLGFERQRPLALLFIDLDNFKRVNDSLGHLAGDRLLQTVGARISATLRTSDLVARFGGDEFIVMLSGATPRLQVEDVARKLLASIQLPVELDQRMISISASVGIAMFPDDGGKALDLLKHADSAMYLAKARGRANFQFFDPARANTAYADLVLEGEIAESLRREHFELHFQPQVGTVDGALAGVEVLLRWNHPGRGLLLPDEFIPVAEQQRLTLPLGYWVLREAVRHAKRWRSEQRRTGPIAVNLSNLQFRSPGFVEGVRRLLREESSDGDLLELEITERTLLDDMSDVHGRLRELKGLGLHISIDDFGTGYFSPRHLKELPVDKVKIDRSFIGDLPHAKDSVAIARAIIQMAGSLGKHVVAEGVENEAQRFFLAEHGCKTVQGNVISPPLPLAQFEAWMDSRALAPPSRLGGEGADAPTSASSM
jgi:diguanylate cyclase (GGDEF)-like protein/PAS domain S-box-containing protein